MASNTAAPARHAETAIFTLRPGGKRPVRHEARCGPGGPASQDSAGWRGLLDPHQDAVGRALARRSPRRGRSPPRPAARTTGGAAPAPPTGAPLTSQVSGGTPPAAFRASVPARPSARREAEIDARAVEREGDLQRRRARVAAMVFGTSLRTWRSGGGRVAVVGDERVRRPSAPARARRRGGRRRRTGSAPRRAAADEARHGGAVRPPDPDADRDAPVEADRPGVAVAVGGAGLEGDAAGRARCRAAARRAGCRRRTRRRPARRCGARAARRALAVEPARRGRGTSPPRAKPA